MNLIGNGLLALLRNPDQLALPRARPELLPSAVEGLLRDETPGTVDVTRDAPRHVAFGGGAHFCLGAALARAEAQIALSALVTLPGLELIGDQPVWRPLVTFHALESLPVACR